MCPYMTYLRYLATIPLTRSQNDPGIEVGWGSAKVAQCAYLSEAERGSRRYFRESTKWKENTAQI